MRPVELRVTGLRSHLGETRITFPEDWQLASVVGPTGAGKSSLLEAMVYALFGSGTVPNASQPINLIADGAREMRVVLSFEVGGVSHEVVRTYRRNGASPAPVLKSPSQTISGARQVEDAVTRVLGLSQDAFCQTALLPQGRFARLLEASASGQRHTLEEFFRLAEVTEVADRIASAADQLTDARDRVSTARDQLPPDPGADLTGAELALDTARKAARSAAELVAAVKTLLDAAAAAEQSASMLDGRAREISDAANALDKVAGRADELARLAEDLTRDEEEADARRGVARTRRDDARARLDELDAPTVTAARTALQALTTRLEEANDAEADEERLRIEADEAENALHRATSELKELEASHLDIERAASDANTAATELANRARLGETLARSVAETMAKLAGAELAARQANGDAEAAADALQRAESQMADAENTLRTAKERAAPARTEANLAAEKAEAARQRLEHIRGFAARVENARTVRDAAASAMAMASEKATSARAAAVSAIAARESARADLNAAEAELEHARRADAAAAAAAGCKPGDPCPICIRELPAGFVVPGSANAIEEAEAAVQSTRSAYDTAAAIAAQAVQRADGAEGDLRTAEQDLSVADGALESAEAVYQKVGGEAGEREAEAVASTATDHARVTEEAAENARRDEIAAQATFDARADAVEPLRSAAERTQRARTAVQEPLEAAKTLADEANGAYADFGSDEALASVRLEADHAAEAARAARETAEAEEEHVLALRARHSDLRVEAANARTAANSAATRLESTRQAVQRSALEVPLTARRAAGEDANKIAKAAEAWTAARETELEEAEHAVAEAQREYDAAGASLDELKVRWATGHDRPLTELIAAAAAKADLAIATAPPTGSSADLAEWARDAATKADHRATEEARAATRARAEAGRDRNEAGSRCQAVGVTPDALGAWRAGMDEAAGKAHERFEQAKVVATRCADLEAALQAAAGRVALLQAGKALSRGQGSFVLHVLSARRRQLLFESAAILTELSGGRLVFDTDAIDRFTVIDASSGAARDPRLLSGGEQFQASLALALGLVEIAARGGSHIECLFLDEGFGALDGRSLDTALDALETAARRGRRILAVTHVDAVTVRCDHVLEVRPTPGGSKVAWLEQVLA